MKHKKNAVKHRSAGSNDSAVDKSSKHTKKGHTFLKRLHYMIFEDESPLGWLVAFIAMFLFLKFIFMPLAGFALQTDYPIVAVISGSMEHRVDTYGTICGKVITDDMKSAYKKDNKTNFDIWWDSCGYYYETNYNLTRLDFESFKEKNGFNIGDVMFLYGTKPNKLKVGDIIVFEGGRSKPIIHRIVNVKVENDKYYFTTKGDHNPESYYFEQDIHEDRYIGRAVFKIPFIGYIKIWVVNGIEWMISIFK